MGERLTHDAHKEAVEGHPRPLVVSHEHAERIVANRGRLHFCFLFCIYIPLLRNVKTRPINQTTISLAIYQLFTAFILADSMYLSLSLSIA